MHGRYDCWTPTLIVHTNDGFGRYYYYLIPRAVAQWLTYWLGMIVHLSSSSSRYNHLRQSYPWLSKVMCSRSKDCPNSSQQVASGWLFLKTTNRQWCLYFSYCSAGSFIVYWCASLDILFIGLPKTRITSDTKTQWENIFEGEHLYSTTAVALIRWWGYKC